MKAFLLFIILLPSVAASQTGLWRKVAVDSFFIASKVVFVDSEVGYVVGLSTKGLHHYDKLLRTSDGGESWAEIDPENARGVSGRFETNGNYCFPSRNAIYAGTNAYVCSFDSGATWIYRPYPPGAGAVNWYMFSVAGGYGEGVQYSLMRTSDSAQTWSKLLPYSEYDYWSDGTHGIAGLYDTEDGQGVSHSTGGFYGWGTSDGGLHWAFHHVPLPALPPLAAAVPNSDTFYLYKAYTIGATSQSNISPYSYFRTTDLGASWELDSTFPGRLSTMSAFGHAIVLALASGDTLAKYHPAEWFAMSYDGSHWRIDSTSAKGLNISSIDFTDATHGWAVGNDTVSFDPTVLTDSTVAYIFKYAGPSLGVIEHHPISPPPSAAIYPNPTGGLLHFQIAVNSPVLRADATDVLGNTVVCPYQAVANGAGSIDVSSLPNGVYELRLSTATSASYKTFVKLH